MAFEYTVNPELDRIVEEKGNTYISFRKITWGPEIDEEKEKLDIRKYYTNADGEEVVGKGVSFLTDEGPHELTKILLEEGYGHSDDIAEAIKNRDDYNDIVEAITNNDNKSEGYFDPNTFIGDDIDA